MLDQVERGYGTQVCKRSLQWHRCTLTGLCPQQKPCRQRRLNLTRQTPLGSPLNAVLCDLFHPPPSYFHLLPVARSWPPSPGVRPREDGPAARGVEWHSGGRGGGVSGPWDPWWHGRVERLGVRGVSGPFFFLRYDGASHGLKKGTPPPLRVKPFRQLTRSPGSYSAVNQTIG